VQRIWDAHKLQPHRVRTFKRSRDPDFAAKLADIVGLYMDCLVAEHCWDPVRLAIVEQTWRFRRLTAIPGQG